MGLFPMNVGGGGTISPVLINRVDGLSSFDSFSAVKGHCYAVMVYSSLGTVSGGTLLLSSYSKIWSGYLDNNMYIAIIQATSSTVSLPNMRIAIDLNG